MAGHGSGRRRLATLSVVTAVTIVLLALAGGLAPSLLPGTFAGQDARWVAAAAIFAASYLDLAVGRVPGLAIDRAGVALVGACLMATASLTSLFQWPVLRRLVAGQPPLRRETCGRSRYADAHLFNLV
jgi:hypothetical protein